MNEDSGSAQAGARLRAPPPSLVGKIILDAPWEY